jgi:hypothetical protein
MPTILDVREIKLEFRDLMARQPLTHEKQKRAPGHHLSGILAHIGQQIGKIDKQTITEELGLDREYSWRWALGIMWEEFWFSLQPNTVWQPGQLSKDGIWVNGDGLTADPIEVLPLLPNGTLLVEETKCTEKKVREPEEFLQEWMWMHQGRGYCKVYGPSITRYTVMYYRGNYKGSGPIVMQYTIGFEQKEIDATWNMLLRFRDEAPMETGE